MTPARNCPFCGDSRSTISVDTDSPDKIPFYSVQCDRCGGCCGLSPTEEKAVEAWNLRCSTVGGAETAKKERALAREALLCALEDEVMSRAQKKYPTLDAARAVAVGTEARGLVDELMDLVEKQ